MKDDSRPEVSPPEYITGSVTENIFILSKVSLSKSLFRLVRVNLLYIRCKCFTSLDFGPLNELFESLLSFHLKKKCAQFVVICRPEKLTNGAQFLLKSKNQKSTNLLSHWVL